MDNTYRNKPFKSLQKKWYRILKETGFDDLEASGELYQPNLRTVGWQNQEQIRNFFLKLDDFLTNTTGISAVNRQVLEMWSAGKSQQEISNVTNLAISNVKNIVYKYKQIVLSYDSTVINN